MAPARRDLPVPMRDGTLLRADLWLPAPETHPGPRPALICRTPYGKGRDPGEVRLAERAAGRGYAVLLQDVRGRYASEGVFAPHETEGADGHDTIEWVAAQDWCDGRVGTFGLSYPGCAQWLAALTRPPHLKAMAPAMSYARLVDCIYYGGVFDADWLRWAVVSMAPDERARRGMAGPATEPKTEQEAWEDWQARPEAEREGFLPLAELPDLEITPYIRRWLTTPPASPWWNFADMTGRYQDIDCAVLHLDGWLDDAYGPKGAIANHLGLCAARKGDRDPRSQLVLGPWAHGIAAVDGRERHGTRELGPGAYIDYDGLVLDFMDRHVRGLETAPRPAAPVRYFVMGSNRRANRWVDAPSWPPPATELALSLHAPGQGSPVGALLADPPAVHGSSSFVNDPLGPLREPPDRAMGAHDLRDLLDLAGDRLAAWESAPLAEDLTVAGNIRAELFVSLDAPDADIYVKILDVAPDGAAYPLMNARAEVLRLSHRDGQRDGHCDGRAPQPLEPGRVYAVALDTLLTANTFLAGHRIRVLVCASWFPALSRNLQTGASEVFTSAARPARITVHCGPGRASRVVLPTVLHGAH